MDICVVGTSKQLFMRVLKLKQNFQKKKVVTGKTPFFVIGPFFILSVLTLASDRAEMMHFQSWYFQQKNSTPIF